MACGGVGGRDEDVAGDAFEFMKRDDEAVAVAVDRQAADDEFAGVGGGDVMAGAILDEFSFVGHGGEERFEGIALRGAVSAKFAEEVLEAGLGVRHAADAIEHLAAG
jgi:hypothetical protein